MSETTEQWERLASEADSWADYLESRGEHAGAHRAKAETYRRAAESIRLEESTGAPHCVCCLKPSGLRRAS